MASSKGRKKLVVDFNKGAVTAEELRQFAIPPPCAHHEDVAAEFCCTDCDTLPLCDVCCRVRHRHHRTLPVKEVAAEKRAEMEKVIAQVEEASAGWRELPARIEAAREKLQENTRLAREKALDHYNREKAKALQEMEEAKEELRRRKEEIQRDHEETVKALNEARDREIQELRDRYARREEEIRSRRNNNKQ